MDNAKSWYQSKTVWGGLIAVGASALQVAGFDLGAGDQADLADIAVTVCGAIGGLVAIYGRIVATHAIAANKA